MKRLILSLLLVGLGASNALAFPSLSKMLFGIGAAVGTSPLAKTVIKGGGSALIFGTSTSAAFFMSEYSDYCLPPLVGKSLSVVGILGLAIPSAMICESLLEGYSNKMWTASMAAGAILYMVLLKNHKMPSTLVQSC